jgi:hypothetical protein
MLPYHLADPFARTATAPVRTMLWLAQAQTRASLNAHFAFPTNGVRRKETIAVTCQRQPWWPKPEATKLASGTATRTPFAASTVCRKALTTSLAPFQPPVALSLLDTSISPALRHVSTHLRQDAGNRARMHRPSAVHGRRSCCGDQQASARSRECHPAARICVC